MRACMSMDASMIMGGVGEKGGAFTLCSCCWRLIGHEGKISSVGGLPAPAPAPARWWYPAAAAACIQRELTRGLFMLHLSLIHPP